MAEIPAELRYTADHEWARPVDELTVRIGITDYAQNSLGDIVFVSVHEGAAVLAVGAPFGEVESTKSVSDLYAPVAGTVLRRNEALDTSPELINRDPYGDGWVVELSVEGPAALDALLDAEAYRILTEQ